MPLAWTFGIEWEEAQIIAPVLGIKLTANEVLGYLQLGGLRIRGEISVSNHYNLQLECSQQMHQGITPEPRDYTRTVYSLSYNMIQLITIIL